MGPQELERLVVRLVGDSSDYHKVLKDSERLTQQAAKTMESSSKMSRATLTGGAGALQRFGDNAKHVTDALRGNGGLSGALGGVSAMVSQVGSGITKLGKSMSLFVTGPLAAFGVFALTTFANFDSAMTQSTAIMSGVTDELRTQMENTAKSLAAETITAPKELANAYYYLASAGFDASQSIQALGNVNDFAIAGMFDMAHATDLLTDAQSALGLNLGTTEDKMKQMRRVSDALVRANTLANASVEQFSIALTSGAGASLRSFNKDVEEGLAVLSAYADQGVKAELAGHQLDRVIRLLSKSSMDNAVAHKELGFEVFDTNGKMRNLGAIIGDLETILSGMSDETKVATLDMLGFEARVQQAILPLIGTSKAIKRYEDQLRSAGGFTKDVADKQMTSFSSQMKIMWNQITLVAGEIGKTLAPAVLWLNGIIKKGIAWWDKLNDSTKKFIVWLGVALGALGPLLVIVGSVVSAIGGFIGVLSVVLLIGAKIILISAAIAAVLFSWVAVIAAVGAAIGYLIYKIVGPESIASAFSKMWTFAHEAFNKIIGFVMNFKTNMKVLIDWLPKNWMYVVSDMAQMFVVFVSNMIKNALVAYQTLTRLWILTQEFFGAKFKQIFTYDFLKWVWEGIKQAGAAFLHFADRAWKAIKSIFSGKKQDVKLSDFVGKMQEDFDPRKDFFGSAKDIIRAGMDELHGPLEGFQSSIKEMPALVFETGKEVGQAAAEGITQGAGNVTQAANELIKGPTEAMINLSEDIKKLTSDLQLQVATFGMSSREADIYKLALRGATDAQLEQARALNAKLTALESERDLMEAGKALTQQMRTPAEKLADRQAELQRMFDAGAISATTFNRAMEQAHAELSKDFKVKFSVSGIQAVEAGTAEALARLEEFRALQKTDAVAAVDGLDPVVAKPVVDEASKIAAVESVGKLALSGTTNKDRVEALLQMIADNTKVDANRPVIVLEEADF